MTATDDRGSRRSPLTPAAVQGGLVVVALVLVAAVALTARQPPPPSVAEIAPEAVERIKDAPPGQGVSAQGGDAPGGATATTTSTTSPGGTRASGGGPAPIDVPRVRHCVGDPPRQIEDPQSPPCVPYFDGSNGGATAPGVTGDSIYLAWPDQFFEDLASGEKLVDFFNSRFEMYGRKIKVEHFSPKGGGFAQPDVSLMQADADGTQTLQPYGRVFASLNYADRKGAEHYYYDRLADLKVISVSHRAEAVTTEARLGRHQPYEWMVLPSTDSLLRSYGEFACKALAHQSPRYAGPAVQQQGGARVFGVIVQEASDGTAPDEGPLTSTLAGCGAPATVVHDPVTGDSTRTGQSVMVELSKAHVTSVICLCDAGEARGTLMPAASTEGYQPEWLVGTYLDQDLDNSFSQGNAPPDQASHVFGALFRNKLLPRQDMPWYWAIKEVAPGVEPSGGAYYSLAARYSSLLLLASGIQMAGPRLTAQTFAAALQRTAFPNPGAGGPPYFQARVGFDRGRHTMYGDGAMFWLDLSRPGTVDPSVPGAVCYVGRGPRYSPGQWPSGPQPFFAGSCL